ncbi:hypothetical protein RSAG8_06881, partial [Rhizoctonia solani AG-8 WAC10335]
MLQYVPGGCTGLFQPCDIGIQCILKVAIENAAHDDIVHETLTMLESGTPPENIVNNQLLLTLRNRSINWMLLAYNTLNKPEIIKKAFSLCAIPNTEFNLSYESLSSWAACQAILDLRSTNPELYAEITAGKNDPVALNLGDKPDDYEVEAENEWDAGVAVSDVCRWLRDARMAGDVAQSLDEESEFDEYEYESEEDSAPIASIRARFSAKSVGD